MNHRYTYFFDRYTVFDNLWRVNLQANLAWFTQVSTGEVMHLDEVIDYCDAEGHPLVALPDGQLSDREGGDPTYTLLRDTVIPPLNGGLELTDEHGVTVVKLCPHVGIVRYRGVLGTLPGTDSLATIEDLCGSGDDGKREKAEQFLRLIKQAYALWEE